MITQFSQRLHLLIIAIIAVSVFACASTPKVYSNADANADFSSYKTYGFFSQLGTDNGNYESMESKHLKAAVTRQMERRGFVKADNPDLEVNFYIHTQEKIRSRTTRLTWRRPETVVFNSDVIRRSRSTACSV